MRIRLKEARQEAGMTQQQMAEQLEVDIRHYKAIESGERLGSIQIWDKLEDIFEISQRVLRENHPGKAGNQ